MSEHVPVDLNALIELAKGTRFESIAGDERRLEEFLLKEMRASEDPMTREVGRGITDGTMTWRTVAATSAYSEYVDHGVQAMMGFDFGAAFEAMEAEKAANEQAAEEAKLLEEHEDEVFSRGVLNNRWELKP